MTVLQFDFDKVFTHVLDHFIVYAVAAVFVALLGVVWHWGIGALNRTLGSVRVHGNWETKICRKDDVWQDHEKVILHQFINRVWGTTTYKQDASRTYRLRGEICGHFVSLVYRQDGTRGFDSGAIALQATPEEQEMEGYEVGYDRDEKKIAPRKYKWTRK
jgi:hypothetical protein